MAHITGNLEHQIHTALKAEVDRVRNKILDEEVANAMAHVRRRLGEVLAACAPVLYRVTEDYGHELTLNVKLDHAAIREAVKKVIG